MTDTVENPQKATELPESLQLEELEVLRLTAVQAVSDKVVLELEFGRSKLQEMQRFLKEKEESLRELIRKSKSLILEIGSKYAVGEGILRYHINLETGEAVLKVPNAPPKVPALPEPPKGT